MINAHLDSYFRSQDYQWDAMHPEDREPPRQRPCNCDEPLDQVTIRGEWTPQEALAYRDDMMFEASSRRCRVDVTV